jgi:hypothetical protein
MCCSFQGFLRRPATSCAQVMGSNPPASVESRMVEIRDLIARPNVVPRSPTFCSRSSTLPAAPPPNRREPSRIAAIRARLAVVRIANYARQISTQRSNRCWRRRRGLNRSAICGQSPICLRSGKLTPRLRKVPLELRTALKQLSCCGRLCPGVPVVALFHDETPR